MTTKYALVTPARNEEAYIGATIESVLAQTILPQRWIIISDCSTDRTDEIVDSYQRNNAFIQLIQLSCNRQRSFGSKVHAVREGIRTLNDVSYDFFGNLDADVTFAPDYFEKLIAKFDSNARLGLAGGTIHELNGEEFAPRIGNVSHSVPGAIQFFRRECYEQIGGYIPRRWGGIDSIAEGMARMHGWEVRSFMDLAVKHHRPTGSGIPGRFTRCFRAGIRDYYMGDSFLFYVCKCARRLHATPIALGALMSFIGYALTMLRGGKIELPEEYVEFLKREQSARLRSLFLRKGER